MSAFGWKTPGQDRSRWPAGDALFFSKPGDQAQQHHRAGPKKYLSRMSVRAGDKIVLIPLRDILWLQSHGNLLRLHLENASYDRRMTLKDMHSRLDPERFLRVHRGAIVNLDHVVEFELPRFGKAFVHLKNGSALPVSRGARLALKRGLLSQASPADVDDGPLWTAELGRQGS